MYGFVIKIHIILNNDKKIVFEGSGSEEFVANFFKEWPFMSVSPKELCAAESVEMMIGLLTTKVSDGDFKIFSKSRPINSEIVEGTFDAYNFIKLIRENVCTIDDIRRIMIELKEYNEFHFYRRYEFDRITQRYIGIEFGIPKIAEECIGEWLDQSILNFKDIEECEIVERKNLYEDSDTEDIYFDWYGCATN